MTIGLKLLLIGTTALAVSMFFRPAVKRKFPNGLPFKYDLMAHRGGSREFVENTLPSFRNAARLQADILEMDVQLTKDGQVVIFHDSTLERMCGLKTQIKDYNFEELPPITIPADLTSIEEVVSDPLSTKIPLFEDVLKEFPTFPMQVDVKNGSEELVLKVGNLIKQYKREHLTVWGSFVAKSGNLCYKHFGTDIPLFFNVYRMLQALVMFKLGILRWMNFRESALICPNYSVFVDPKFVSTLHSCGVSVLFFGNDGTGAINTMDGWIRIAQCAPVGICSDRPTALKQWLQSRQ